MSDITPAPIPTVDESAAKASVPAEELVLPDGVVDALPVVIQKEVKSGFKTSEFVVGFVISALTLIGTIPMPDHYKAYVVGGLGAAYAISRGLSKLGGKPTVVVPPQ